MIVFEQLHTALIEACAKPDFTDSSSDGKVKLLLKLVSQLLGVARASAWRYSQDKSRLVCHCLYMRESDQYDAGAVLTVEDYPRYFAAMATSRVVVANNAWEHPATSEFADKYLAPLGIYAMVDTPIYSSSSHHGILCIEGTDKQRQWKIEEVSLIVAVADKISLVLENEAWLKATGEIFRAQRTDALTGLENRYGFQERIESCRSCSSRHRCVKDNCVLLIGIDRLSSLNDQLGYNQVNQLLKVVADRLVKLSIENHKTFVARIASGRFAVFVPQVSIKIEAIINAVIDVFCDEFELQNGIMVRISACVGAVEFSGTINDSDNPLRKAEVALNKARDKGVGSYTIFDDKWVSEYKRRKKSESELVNALRNSELIPFYQPIIDCKTDKVVGVEALVRWNHPSKGILTPYNFLPLATEMNLMTQLGELMLRAVCRDINQNATLQSLSWISVNLSAEQLYNNALVSLVKELMSEFDIPKNTLEIEIVEELINYDTALVNSQLKMLDEIGVKLAIDDFGTGYSSLSRLKHIPVSKLKIDRSFVDGLPADESDRCISGSIIGMARGLCLSVVAEGVETEEQARWLKANNCDYIQGYWYAKPMSIEALNHYVIGSG